jgi:hypothetical protein
MERYGLAVAAVHRAGYTLVEPHLGKCETARGRCAAGARSARCIAHELNDQHNLILLEKHTPDPMRVRKGYISIGLFLVAITLSATSGLPTAIAFMSAALATVVLRITESMKAYASIDWRLIILIGGMTAMGTAMVNSGADVFLSTVGGEALCTAGCARHHGRFHGPHSAAHAAHEQRCCGTGGVAYRHQRSDGHGCITGHLRHGRDALRLHLAHHARSNLRACCVHAGALPLHWISFAWADRSHLYCWWWYLSWCNVTGRFRTSQTLLVLNPHGLALGTCK